MYQRLKESIQTSFMPAILGGVVSSEECDLFSLPVTKGGLAWTDPVASAKLFFDTSKAGTAVLERAIRQGLPFDIEDHRTRLREAKGDAVRTRKQAEDNVLQSVLEKFSIERQRAIGRAVIKTSGVKTSGWLSALPLKKHNYDLSPSEFRDALAVRYKRRAPNLPVSCDGCGRGGFNMEHALSCKKGGLISRRHNEIRDVLGELMLSAWGNCCKEPVIVETSLTEPGLRGDLACRGVWERQRDALFDIRVVDTDAPSYLSRSVAAVLSSAEEEKKRKYIEACEQRRASFTPLVSSVDAVFAPQMVAFIKVLGERLAEKWDRPQGLIRGWLRARIAFAVVRATSMCIRGSRKKWRSAEDLLGFTDGAAVQMGLPQGEREN